MTFLALLDDSTISLWAAIRPEFMTISSEDLTMKFGAVMDGIWTVVGIVDAGVGEPNLFSVKYLGSSCCLNEECYRSRRCRERG